MTDEEQITICKAITKACMWGSGVGPLILEELQKRLPMARDWKEVSAAHAKEARYEAVGVVKDEDELQRYLARGYWLTNYEPNEMALFNPPPMNGLYKYLVGDMAEKYGKSHDPWNHRIFALRAEKST